MTEVKAVITDYIGTLTNARSYSFETSRRKLRRILKETGFEPPLGAFLTEYSKAHEKYRVVRYSKLREVTNAVWVSEALNALGYKTSVEDPRIKAALNVFFQDYVDTLELRPYAKTLLQGITEKCKLGLISNFTYTPAIYASLRKLGVNHFFNSVVVSEDAGWRKPHKRIFQTALQKLQVKAEEAVFIGDSPLEDIEGAKTAGLKTIFVLSQFNKLEDLRGIKQQPDMIAEDLQEIAENLDRLITAKQKQTANP